MGENLSRELASPKKVRTFLTEILQWNYDDTSIEAKIAKGQIGIEYFNTFKNYNTYDNTDFRDKKYYSDDDRWGLRAQIIKELLSQERLPNDDKICLGVDGGGACPASGVKNDKKAYLIIGLPASGKSKIANTISDNIGGIIVDSDYAKRKLPEFSDYEYGATLVHKESSKIVSGFDDKPHRFDNIISLNEAAILQGANIVLPKIGHSLNDLLILSDKYKKLSYEIHLILVNLNRRKATIRAINRYLETERYIPLDLIYDEYANDPILNYYQLKNHMPDKFNSYGMISTNVNYNDPFRCIEFSGDNPAQLWEPILFEETLNF